MTLTERLAVVEWDSHAINDAIKAAATAHGMKMPKVAMPLRVMVTGEAQTPSINAMLELLGREETLKRMSQRLAQDFRLSDILDRHICLPPALH